jgi:hypothetical protein
LRRIPWKLKSFLFRIIDIFQVDDLLYFAQKHLTRRSKRSFAGQMRRWHQHEAVIKQVNASPVVFEFGAGKDLAQNLFLSSCAGTQYLVDLNFMLDLNLCEAARLELAENSLIEDRGEISSALDLLKYGINYEAPADAADTHLPDESVDICISTATLEHIPETEISKILIELGRVIKMGGLVSAVIDYSDHYAHTDRSISQLNFLRYSDQQWSSFNHKCHYQNRLRHGRYIDLFNEHGFELIQEELDYSDQDIPPGISDLFVGHDPSWKAVASHCVFVKKSR